jgi:hypothetical protein
MLPFMLAKSNSTEIYTVRWKADTGRVYMRSQYNGCPVLQENEIICTREIYDWYNRYRYIRGILIEQPE